MHTRQDAAAPAQPQHIPAGLALSRPEPVEAIADLGRRLPCWAPLEKLCPPGLCEQFMFMGCEKGMIYLYKHVDSRHYLNIDANGQTYAYNPRTAGYDPITLATAIELLARP